MTARRIFSFFFFLDRDRNESNFFVNANDNDNELTDGLITRPNISLFLKPQNVSVSLSNIPQILEPKKTLINDSAKYEKHRSIFWMESIVVKCTVGF